ncbi:MAG: ribonuclease HII [Clostridiaceae bacterium]|nr:ribonuclease HII [Clostridiaceae bacterium]
MPGLAGKRLERAIAKYVEMRSYEKAAMAEGCTLIAGIDEAGRGPLAGPVVACACILHPERPVYGVDDSKKLSADKRDLLFELIRDRCVAYACGIEEAPDIDRINILNATKRAMLQAVSQLHPRPDRLLIDAVDLKGSGIPVVPIIKGDALSVSIAAASILAKVTRDRIMEALDVQYPGYGFARHKGYGTAEHYEALRRLGPCPAHRLTFLGSLDRHV